MKRRGRKNMVEGGRNMVEDKAVAFGVGEESCSDANVEGRNEDIHPQNTQTSRKLYTTERHKHI